MFSSITYGQDFNIVEMPFDEGKVNSFTTTLTADSSSRFVKNLKKEYGDSEIYQSKKYGKELRWIDISKPEWYDQKLNIRLRILMIGQNRMIVISVVNQKGRDLIKPEKESFKKIKEDLISLLPD